MTWLWIAIAVVVDGLAGLAGALVPEPWLERHRTTTLGFAAGALLGAATLDVIPEAVATGPTAWLWIAGTIVALAVWELGIARRHHAHDGHAHGARHINVFALLGSDALHNLGDGLAVASAFLVSARLGVVTAAAVIVHEIPQEVADYALLRASGTPRRTALLALAGVQLTAAIGAAGAVLAAAATAAVSSAVLAIAAGTFAFIGASLIGPQLVRGERRIGSLVAFGLGVAVVAVTT